MKIKLNKIHIDDYKELIRVLTEKNVEISMMLLNYPISDELRNMLIIEHTETETEIIDNKMILSKQTDETKDDTTLLIIDTLLTLLQRSDKNDDEHLEILYDKLLNNYHKIEKSH